MAHGTHDHELSLLSHQERVLTSAKHKVECAVLCERQMEQQGIVLCSLLHEY
jgi:predicted HD phosphohydrolase